MSRAAQSIVRQLHDLVEQVAGAPVLITNKGEGAGDVRAEVVIVGVRWEGHHASDAGALVHLLAALLTCGQDAAYRARANRRTAARAAIIQAARDMDGRVPAGPVLDSDSDRARLRAAFAEYDAAMETR